MAVPWPAPVTTAWCGLWDPDVDHVLAEVCRAMGRDLTAEQWARLIPYSPYQHACG
jgi:hypothetical protein